MGSFDAWVYYAGKDKLSFALPAFFSEVDGSPMGSPPVFAGFFTVVLAGRGVVPGFFELGFGEVSSQCSGTVFRGSFSTSSSAEGLFLFDVPFRMHVFKQEDLYAYREEDFVRFLDFPYLFGFNQDSIAYCPDNGDFIAFVCMCGYKEQAFVFWNEVGVQAACPSLDCFGLFFELFGLHYR